MKSLPFILTTDASQEVTAKGLLLWDAAFSEPVNKEVFAAHQDCSLLVLSFIVVQ